MDAGAWMDFQEPFGGGEAKSGVAVLGASVVGRLPSTLDIRAPADEEHAEPRLPGRGPLPLAKGEEVVLRYRLILHRGGADSGSLGRSLEE